MNISRQLDPRVISRALLSKVFLLATTEHARFSLKSGLAIKGLAMFASTTFSLFLPKIVSPSVYGQYSLLLVYINLIVAFSVVGIPTLILRRLSKLNNPKIIHRYKSIIRNLQRLTSIGIAPISILTFLYIVNFSAFEAAIAAVIVVIISINRVQNTYLQASGRTTYYIFLSQFIRPFIYVWVIAGFYFYSANMSLIWLMGAELAIAIIINRVGNIGPKVSKLKSRKPLNAIDKKIIKYAGLLGCLSFIQVFQARLDIIILDFFVAKGDLGVYSYALKIATLVNLVTLVTISVKGPQLRRLLAEKKISKSQIILSNASKFNFLFSITVLLIFLAFGKYAISIVNPEYSGAYRYAMIIMSIMSVSNLFAMNDTVVMLTLRYSTLLKVVSTLAILSATLHYFLISLWGLEGAIWAFAIFAAIQNIVFTKVAHREHSVWTMWILTKH